MATLEPIPPTQKAYVLSEPGGSLKFVTDHPVPSVSSLAPGQCLIKVLYSGVCSTDLSVRENAFAAFGLSRPNIVGGHEGVGIVIAIAEHTKSDAVKLGDRVGIKWIAESCGLCELCLKGLETLCHKHKSSGATVDGTFCEYTVSYVDWLTLIPEKLPSPDAAGFMCAGVTAYASLLQCNCHIGDWIAISGAGGGLGHLAIQYAVAMGLNVIAIDSGSEKRELCLSLGAHSFVDFRTSSDIASDVRLAAEGAGVHSALIYAGGNDAYAQAAAYLRSNGCLVAVGIPKGEILSLPVVLLVARGLVIKGIMAGNRQHAIEAINLAASGKVICRFTYRGLSELEKVYDEMSKGQIAGRIILDISK